MAKRSISFMVHTMIYFRTRCHSSFEVSSVNRGSYLSVSCLFIPPGVGRALVYQYYIHPNCNCSLFLLQFHPRHSFIHTTVRWWQMLCPIPTRVFSLWVSPTNFLYLPLLLPSPLFVLSSNCSATTFSLNPFNPSLFHFLPCFLISLLPSFIPSIHLTSLQLPLPVPLSFTQLRNTSASVELFTMLPRCHLRGDWCCTGTIPLHSVTTLPSKFNHLVKLKSAPSLIATIPALTERHCWHILVKHCLDIKQFGRVVNLKSDVFWGFSVVSWGRQKSSLFWDVVVGRSPLS